MSSYEQRRNEIKTGDILAWSHGGNWNSWKNLQLNLIRMSTMSEYTHVGIAYVMDGRVFIIEAVIPEIRISILSKELPCFLLKTPFEFKDEHKEKLLSKVGLPYSKWEAIKSVFTKDTNGQSVWECAKLVNQTLKDFDIGFDDMHDTPSNVVRYLQEKHGCELLFIY